MLSEIALLFAGAMGMSFAAYHSCQIISCPPSRTACLIASSASILSCEHDALIQLLAHMLSEIPLACASAMGMSFTVQHSCESLMATQQDVLLERQQRFYPHLHTSSKHAAIRLLIVMLSPIGYLRE